MGLSGRVGSMKGRKILPFCCCVLCRELPSGGVRGGRGHFDSKSELLKGYFESSAPYFVKFIVPCTDMTLAPFFRKAMFISWV